MAELQPFITHTPPPVPIGAIWTVGHSNRTLEEFLALLQAHGIRHVLDVRRWPSSHRWPHFGGEALARALVAAGRRYTHLPALGGYRRPRPDSPHLGWTTPGFRGYADHMESPEFAAALEEVVRAAAQGRAALLCAEAIPWRCHRRLIADALVARGLRVLHIVGPGRVEEHRLPPFARVEGGRVRYPG